MCYFSDEEKRKTKHGRLTQQQIEDVAYTLFRRTLKVQIGCGAEPTLDLKSAIRLVQLAKQYHVPYISLTTNGVLLTEDQLRILVTSGLNEITLSLHGIHKDTYEKLMGPTSNYDLFVQLLATLKTIKRDFPDFHIRINYTMNADNVDELQDWDTLFGDFPLTELQLRPIRKIGDSVYHNFDLSHVAEVLPTIVYPLAERCKQKGVCVILPQLNHIHIFAKEEKQAYRQQLLSVFTYINISPTNINQSPIHYGQEDYEHYAHRTRLGRSIFRLIFVSEKLLEKEYQTTLSAAMNYDIQ